MLNLCFYYFKFITKTPYSIVPHNIVVVISSSFLLFRRWRWNRWKTRIWRKAKQSREWKTKRV